MKERISDTARELIFRHGVRGFTMDDIADSLGISKKTVYKYYSGKKQLISSIVDKHVENDKKAMLEAVEKETDVVKKLRAAVSNYYGYRIPLTLIDEMKRYFPEEWEKVEGLFSFKRELFKKLFMEGVMGDSLKQDINIDVLMLIIDRSINAIMDYSFLAEHDLNYLTANSMLDEMKKIVLYGVVKA